MLTESEIKQFITDDFESDVKRHAKTGLRYYEGDHDILDYRLFYFNAEGDLVEDTTRTNARIPHPFFTELVDQEVAYMLSGPDNPIHSDVEGLQDYLDTYFDEDFWSEASDLLCVTVAAGWNYMYGYQSADDRIKFQATDDCVGVVEVRAKDTDDNCEYVVYWYVDRIDKGHKLIKRIQVWDKDRTYFYVQDDDGAIISDSSQSTNPRPHVIYQDENDDRFGYGLGFIPFWRLDNGRKKFSGLKPIKDLIDDYDLMECGLSNNIQDFDTPLHVVKGFDGDDLTKLQQNIKTTKMIGVAEDGDVEVRTIDIPYAARKTKADEDEKNIYRFGMGINTAGLKDTSATTNIAIKMAYTLLDLKASKLEKRFKQFLRQLIKVAIEEINEKDTKDFQLNDVKIEFRHEILVNETENAQIDYTKAQTEQLLITTVLNVAAQLGEEITVRQICDILDLDYDEICDKLPTNEEDDTAAAAAALKGTEPDTGIEQKSIYKLSSILDKYRRKNITQKIAVRMLQALGYDDQEAAELLADNTEPPEGGGVVE